MPVRVEQGIRAIDLTYGPGRSRIKRIDTNETGGSTTHYIAGGTYETITTSTGQITRRLTIAGVAVVLDTQTSGGGFASETSYLLTDHLGSLDAVTDTAGTIIERHSFDAWGKRRKFDWTVYAGVESYPWQGQRITRGYTFHEQLDPVGLIHMNGRVYDADIGRFLSPDIVIQDITNSQAFNSYSYVLNNPLSLTDPSGFFFSGLFRSIGGIFKSVFRAIGNAFKAVLNSQIGRALVQIAACTFGPAACVAASAAITLATGGSIGDAVKAAAWSFAQVGVWDGVGNFLDGVLPSLSGVGAVAAKGIVHGTVGGALSVAQGGSFFEGFAANGIGGAVGYVSSGIGGDGGLYVRTALAATAGGLASEITGGKFSNGAITAGFAHLFNAEAHNCGPISTKCGPGQRVFEGAGGGGGTSAGLGLAGVGLWFSQQFSPANDNLAGTVHGNSSASRNETEVYYLINRDSGVIDKIGITSHPTQRYSDTYLAAENVIYQTQAFYSYRYPAMVDENIRLNFFRLENGRLPRLNRVAR